VQRSTYHCFGLSILAMSVGGGMLATVGARAFLRQPIRTKCLLQPK
jgi:hypothetical protein